MEGYKHTTLGLIPEEWDVKELDKNINILTGFAFKGDEFTQGGIKLLRGSNVKRNNVDWNPEITRYCPKPEKHLDKYGLAEGDLVIAMDGALIGRSFARIQKKDLPCYLVQRVARLRGENIDQGFLHLIISDRSFETHVDAVKTDGAIPHISPTDIKNFIVPLPPLAEQRNIAAVLSTWDRAIAAESALISVLQTRHHALMERLLSGRVCLNGFAGEWTELRIASVAKEVSTKNKVDKILTVLSCTKYNGLVPSLEYFGRKIFADNLTTYKVVPRNHFAYATNHIEEGSIGYQDKLDEGLISPMYTVFKTSQSIVDDLFLFRLLKTPNYVLEYRRRMEGSIDRRGGLRWDDFSRIKLSLPSIAEQRAITQILTTSESEIAVRRAHLAALQEQKKGLMQVLLTGRLRVYKTTTKQ